MPIALRGPRKAMRGKCERGHGSANADGAGAKGYAGDGCSQGASFDPMAAISQRGQGGRIYNNTRAREPLWRKCVKPADLTTHSPPKTFARPRTATPPFRALPLPPRSPDAHPQAARRIPRPPHNPFPAEGLRPPPLSDTPSRALLLPHTAPMHARWLRDAFPSSSQPIPHRRPSPAPTQRHALLPFRFGHKKTAPHSACAMPNVSVDRRCGRSFGLVSRALFAAVAGRWRVGVGLRPQPWALRSRRCGRVLRA